MTWRIEIIPWALLALFENSGLEDIAGNNNNGCGCNWCTNTTSTQCHCVSDASTGGESLTDCDGYRDGDPLAGGEGDVVGDDGQTQGSVVGILVGSLLIGVLQNEMVMLNINPFWHKIVIGTVLLIAITFDYARHRKRN